MSRQVIKSATKKRLLDLGFPETVAHDLARGVKFTELLQLGYDEPLHEETTMTPKSIIENSAHVNLLDLAPYYAKSNNGEWVVETAYSFNKRLSKAINSLNQEKITKFMEWFAAQKIEESGYFNFYYGTDKNRSRYYNNGVRSFFLIPLPRLRYSLGSQTPQEIRDLIRKFPKWESQLRMGRERSQDEILITLEDFIKEYNQEWSAYIRGKLWNSSPRWPSFNFPLGI